MKDCERCKASPSSFGDRDSKLLDRPGVRLVASFALFDYCAACGRDLCPKCMEAGCCGVKPAESGQQADHGESDE